MIVGKCMKIFQIHTRKVMLHCTVRILHCIVLHFIVIYYCLLFSQSAEERD